MAKPPAGSSLLFNRGPLFQEPPSPPKGEGSTPPAPDSGSTTPAAGGPPASGGDPGTGGGRPPVDGDPVYVTYHDGRRGNSGMGLYYLGGTHRIGLAEYGVADRATPKSFKPLWMNDEKDIYTSLFDAPRPGGSREGEVTGILNDKKTTYVVFKDEKNKFQKQAFKMNNKEGMASSEEEKATNKWIHNMEKSHTMDLNGDNIFGNPKNKSKKMSSAEHNNDIFENKLNDKKLLKQLRKGGHVIYLRHATTETDYADQADPNLDLDDPSTQRMLSDQGIKEAEDIGAVFKANDILVGKVFSSEYQRAKDTADLAFGKKYKVNKDLNFLPFEDYTDEQLDTYHDRLAPMLSKKPKNAKKNTVIVGHDDPFEGTTNIYPDPQATAYVIKPHGDSYDIVGKLVPNDWAIGADI
jgi:phosphohistidine phosphatase SixA